MVKKIYREMYKNKNKEVFFQTKETEDYISNEEAKEEIKECKKKGYFPLIVNKEQISFSYPYVQIDGGITICYWYYIDTDSSIIL